MKRKNIVITIITIIFVAIAGYFLWSYLDSKSSEYIRLTRGIKQSPDKKYSVILKSTKDPSLGNTNSFEDSVKVIIEEQKTDKKLAVIETSTQCDVTQIDNGHGFTWEWDAIWQDDSVKIILKGNEQQDKVFVVPLQ